MPRPSGVYPAENKTALQAQACVAHGDWGNNYVITFAEFTDVSAYGSLLESLEDGSKTRAAPSQTRKT